VNTQDEFAWNITQGMMDKSSIGMIEPFFTHLSSTM
jgi:hypothetical protein